MTRIIALLGIVVICVGFFACSPDGEAAGESMDQQTLNSTMDQNYADGPANPEAP